MTTTPPPGDPNQPAGGYGYGGQPQPQAQQSSTPLVLGIIGIVCWFLCGIGAIASIILGLIGQNKARELGQSDTVPKVAWIGGVVFVALWIIGFIVRLGSSMG